MANYKESAVVGTKWTRSPMIRVANPYEGIPKIYFAEEAIVNVGGQIIKQSAAELMLPELVEAFIDPGAKFELLDPDTDALLGEATYADLRTILYSMYRHLAQRRDDTAITSPAAVDIPKPPVDDVATDVVAP